MSFYAICTKNVESNRKSKKKAVDEEKSYPHPKSPFYGQNGFINEVIHIIHILMWGK